MRKLQQCLLVLSFSGIALSGCKQRAVGFSRPAEAAVAAGEIGSHLPEFAVKDLQGREILSANLPGRVVLIDFWATWCQPCKQEMPGYQALLDRYGPRGLVVVGFKFDMMVDAEDPLTFAHRIGVRYPLAVAPDDLKQRFGGIEGLPTTMLYDRQGILRKKVVGFEYTETFDSTVRQLLSIPE
jgi:thiol-disulfide isomerase/thioredoxin